MPPGTEDERGALERLLGELQDPSLAKRAGTADALGHRGFPARDVVPALIEALRDSSPMVRLPAAGSLGWLGPDEHEHVREAARQALAKIGG